MFRRALTICVILGFASMAHGAAVIELTAMTPENGVGGYLPGTTVDFDVAMTTDAAIQARLLTLDFSASSPELVFTGPDSYPLDAVGQPLGDGVEEFVFEFGTVMNSLYGQFPNYPVSNITYTSTFPIAGFMLEFAPGTPLVIGHGTVILPMVDGVYNVDALNMGAQDNNVGARIDFDFGNPQMWHVGNGMMTGEALALTVIPEPATLLLLGLGGVAVLRRRR